MRPRIPGIRRTLGILTLCALIAPGALVAQGTSVSGLIQSSTRWTAAGSPYTVTGNVTVGNDATLHIDPGAVVQFTPGTGIEIGDPNTGAGALKARGTASLPIRFTSTLVPPAPGDWGSIRFEDDAVDGQLDGSGAYVSGSILEHCHIEHGGWPLAAVFLDHASPFLHECTIENNAHRAVHAELDRGPSGLPTRSLHIRRCVLRNNLVPISAFPLSGGGGAMLIGGGGHVIEDCSFVRNRSHAFGGGVHVLRADGVTIRNSLFHDNLCRSGGAIGMDLEGTVTIDGNTIRDNDTTWSGGGIYVQLMGHTAVISDNTIRNNLALQGGGIMVEGLGQAMLTGNGIENNTAVNDGGGVNSANCDLVTFRNDTIAGNVASQGGGVRCFSVDDVVFDGCIIANNTAVFTAFGGFGGGMWIGTRSATLSRNTIAGNRAARNGGGVSLAAYLSGGTFTVTDNAVYGNHTDDRGGGISLWVPAAVSGNSFAANSAAVGGGGIYVQSAPAIAGSPATGAFNTFLGNSSPKGDAIFYDMRFGSPDLNAAFTCWAGTWMGQSRLNDPNLIWDFFDDSSLAFITTANPASCEPFASLGGGTAGSNGVPALGGSGTLAAGTPWSLVVASAAPGMPAVLLLDAVRVDIPFAGGLIVPGFALQLPFGIDGSGRATLLMPTLPPGIPAETMLYMQALVADPTTASGLSFSNALVGVTP